MADYSRHQKKIIERYYDRRDEIMLAKLQEIVTELFLSETEKKSAQLWARAEKAMISLKVEDSIREHILTKREPEMLARHLRGWLEDASRLRQQGRPSR